MIPRRNSHTILLLLAVAFVTLITIVPTACLASVVHDGDATATATTAPFHCPESCTCTDLTVGHRDLRHARCENIDALQDKQWAVNSLDLSSLDLNKVPAVVEKLRNVTRLDLSNNHITEVARLGHRLQDLNLGYNKIGSGKLAKLPLMLRKLNLTHNHITVVPSELKKLEHLRELELAGNPINCSCETIQVRNWLLSRHVWTENVIKCALPLKYKGRPWLQVKQSEVCPMTPAEIQEEKNIWEDSNDLMMGDQPAAGSGEGHTHDHEALEDDYMRYDDDPRSEPHTSEDEELEEGSGEPIPIKEDVVAKSRILEVEGSGSVDLPHMDHFTTVSPTGGDDEEEDGSGEVIVPPLFPINRNALGGEKPPKPDSDFHEDQIHEDEGPIEQPAEGDHPTPGPSKGLGIFQPNHPDDETENPVVKEVAPIVEATPSSTRIMGPDGTVVKPTETADSSKLYILLGIIFIVMVSLIMIVVFKQRSARNRNNRRGQADVENAKLTELQDMNQRMVGKPLEKKNGGENAPLIGQKDKSDFAKPTNGQRDCDKVGFNPYEKPDSPIREKHIPLKSSAPVGEEPNNDKPELGSFKPTDRAESKNSLYENNDKNNNNNNDDMDNNNNQFQPIQNGYPQENGVGTHSPSMDSPASVHKTKRDEDWEKYTPRSPDMKRYSPVYSPETGRVKIKLSETPKPKTPLLVMRSRSNGGEMITTPNLNQRPQRPAIVDVAES